MSIIVYDHGPGGRSLAGSKPGRGTGKIAKRNAEVAGAGQRPSLAETAGVLE
jgi:hypothetical protein